MNYQAEFSLDQQFKKLLKSCLEQLEGYNLEMDKLISVEKPRQKSFGDAASNIALSTAKQLGRAPRDIAEELRAKLETSNILSEVNIAGPGFLNVCYSSEAYKQAHQELQNQIDKNNWGNLNIGQGKKAITDSSHPNIAKPMGVHHLLSTVIGQAINELLINCGYEVVRDNYLGDWGTQYGKLMYAIEHFGNMEVIKQDPIPELLKLYVLYHQESEKNPELDDKARALFKALENKDPQLTELWQWIRKVSIESCQQVWNRVGAKYDIINGESFYEEMLDDIVEEGLKKGVIVEGEQGALIIETEDENKPPVIIKKKDGASIYATRDLARIKYWQDTLKADIGVNIVDVAQKLYFEQLFEAAEKMGFTKMQNIHVEFGRMSFPEGGMSTRKGKVMLLESVLDEAEKRALEKIKEHNSSLEENEQIELARKMGIGAVKYNILSQNRLKNYTFNWDVMLSFDGNSAPYLQYAYTRTQSILNKVQTLNLPETSFELALEAEKELFTKLLDYEKALYLSLKDYKPNILCQYLFELCQTFSQMYNDVRIIDEENLSNTANRLLLVQAVAYTLEKGLGILGIELPKRM